MGSPTECLTLSTCEWTGLDGLSLKDEGVCSLSDILETGDVPQRYFLSAKACSGILRRADKRGKELPPQLAAALQAVAGSAQTSTAMADCARDYKGSRPEADQGASLVVAHTLSAQYDSSPQDGWGGTPIVPVAFQSKASAHQSTNPSTVAPTLDVGKHDGLAVAHTLREHTRNNSNPATEAAMHVIAGMAVRRLTPRECERLQGFPDDYTLVTHRKKSAADGPRYKALGNSMAVNCMRWIGTRIHAVEVAKQND
jgi:site-specific DNA-cytosine methylase